MITLPFRPLTTFLVLALAPIPALHAELPVIAKARAYLGSETALNAVKSVHYSGKIVRPNPADPAKPDSLALDIIFQSPYRQRTVRTTDTDFDTVALDGYDGWHSVRNRKNPARVRLELLSTDQVKRQRALVQENLTFFRGLEREGGQVLDQGLTRLDGVACRKVAFIHSANIIFFRYFDESTGRLIMTETENGSTTREQGEILVNGIRFPKRIINSSKTAAGKEQTVTVVFEAITLNETFPDRTFAIPPSNGK